jgi:hypothetical protein
MAVLKHPSALLGLDIGGLFSRAILLGIAEGKYQVLGAEKAPTSYGHDFHIGVGVGEAMRALQVESGHTFIKETGGLMMPVDRLGRGVDRVALVVTAGQRIKTGLLGLTDAGSLKAGRALIESLPMQSSVVMGLVALENEIRAIETLIKTHPELLLMTGGEESGAQEPLTRWIEIVRTACSLLPESARPWILYAGNPTLEPMVKRRLEPVTCLQVVPNLQPAFGEYDFVQAQISLEGEILRCWKHDLPGLGGLRDLTGGLSGVAACSVDRMMRFISLRKQSDSVNLPKVGALAVDLGGQTTLVSAGLGGLSGTVVQDKFDAIVDDDRPNVYQLIRSWCGEPVTLDEVCQFLYNHQLLPGWVPETRVERALAHAFARFRLCQAVKRLSENYAWFDYDPRKGLRGHYEPVIASGLDLTHAPSPGEVLFTLLNGLQPWGVTTMVLDKYHVLPLLGKIGEVEAVLPVQVLSSSAFENLGTVLSTVGDLTEGKTALNIHVETASGKDTTVEIKQGALKRLLIPAGETAVLTLMPHQRIDIGFGGRGQGGRLKVIGGTLGAVIDARGRPVPMPIEEAARIGKLQAWLGELGAEHA